MTHTLPDYTTKYKLSKIFSSVDTNENAARLGACSTMDRRGNLIWYDDFEAPVALKWGVSTDAGGAAAISTTRCWMGTQSMKSSTHTDIGDQTSLGKVFCLPIERTMGIEYMFNINNGKPIVRIYVVGYTGTAYFMGQIQYDHDLQKIYYYNSASAWIELPLADNNLTVLEHWFLMKLVIDWDKKEYVRFIFGGTEYDLSGIGMKTGANVTKKSVSVILYNIAQSAEASIVYYDNFILTQNEP
jgi:hypothetical protein